MGFVEAVKHCLRNYVNFSGRAPRAEYWYFFLFNFILAMIVNVLDHLFFMPSNAEPGQYGPLGAILMLGLLLPGLAVSARRLHDIDKSGWWILIAFIPLIGAIILIIWYCKRATAGANRFGEPGLRSSN